MELEVLKKKLSSFKSNSGRVKNVSDELLLEVLSAWELFPGTAKDFYTSIGVSSKGISSMLGKAKRLKREGVQSNFKELKIDGLTDSQNQNMLSFPCDIELYDKDKIIRFRKIDLLIEYLKKVA